jgi:hypothetical protein
VGGGRFGVGSEVGMIGEEVGIVDGEEVGMGSRGGKGGEVVGVVEDMGGLVGVEGGEDGGLGEVGGELNEGEKGAAGGEVVGEEGSMPAEEPHGEAGADRDRGEGRETFSPLGGIGRGLLVEKRGGVTGEAGALHDPELEGICIDINEERDRFIEGMDLSFSENFLLVGSSGAEGMLGRRKGGCLLAVGGEVSWSRNAVRLGVDRDR